MYAKVALNLPIDREFDYLIPDTLSEKCTVGARVWVSFGQSKLVGYVTEIVKYTTVSKIKPILSLIDSTSILPESFLEITKWAAKYYCSSWGEAISAALPVGVRKGLSVKIASPAARNDTRETARQNSKEKNIYLFEDYNLKNRLDFYAQEIEKTLAKHETVLIIAPELSLTNGIFEFFAEIYPQRVKLIHRKQKIHEELKIWEEAASGGLDVLIGTRSCVFTPLANLGLIILESEESYGYKEEQSPYYHARDVALERARSENIQLILSCAVPSLESFYGVKTNKYVQIASSPLASRNDPKGATSEVMLRDNIKITIVDMRLYACLKRKNKAISLALEERISKALVLGKKVIVFINKKGFAGFAHCQKCGFLLVCDKCNTHLIYSQEEKKLICNLCGIKKDVPGKCPKCNNGFIKFSGIGIEKVINQLSLLFPGVKIARLDKGHTFIDVDAQIIVATEMIFHAEENIKAAIVAALDLDSALNIINYRASEKNYSLLFKLKNLASEEFIIQTNLPDYYRALGDFNLDDLYNKELRERKTLNLPPYTHLININLRGIDSHKVKKASFNLFQTLKSADEKLNIFSPIEASPFKLRGKYRYYILIKTNDPLRTVEFLRGKLKIARGIITTVDVDPQ